MFSVIDTLLNGITMYRLILYYLVFLVGLAIVYSFAGLLPYDPWALLFSTTFLITICWITNTIFARTFRVPPNVESVYISALILALIITPIVSASDLTFLIWAGVWAMASKYIIAINRKHLFNPAAFAVALTALTVNQTASWWVADMPMLPFVLIGGLLIVRKTQKFGLVLSFLITALVASIVFGLVAGEALPALMQNTLVYTPLMFFAFVILTEPLTLPPTRKLQLIYGMIVGFLFVPQLHIGSFYFTPELSILMGNLFAFAVSPKAKLVLRLKEKIQLAPDIYDFIFVPNHKLPFVPGQYMEWTLGHHNPDSRGNRRYFTLASSPTETNLRLGVKFYPNSSSYKQSMLSMNQDTEIVAGQLAGDFVLPEDRTQKCVLIAGGIGITPFRSMVKYLIDTNQHRRLVLFYAVKSVEDIVYKDIFDKAERKLGIKTIYTITGASRIPSGWGGKVGRINAQMIKGEVPDYYDCVFYLSGPNAMVTGFEAALNSSGSPEKPYQDRFLSRICLIVHGQGNDILPCPCLDCGYSTVTLFARLRGWSTSAPRHTAI